MVKLGILTETALSSSWELSWKDDKIVKSDGEMNAFDRELQIKLFNLNYWKCSYVDLFQTSTSASKVFPRVIFI